MTDLRKLCLFFLGFFKEDDGKPSQKRLISFALTLVLCYHSIRTPQDTELLITMFSFIGILQGFTYIPTRK